MTGKLKSRMQFDRSQVKLMIKFLKTLQKKLGSELSIHFEDPAQLAVFEAKIQGLIEELIYAVYEPRGYQRTYRLLRSFRATGTGQEGTSEISVWSDPSIAPSKTDPSLSYAAFFERPDEFKTFIQPRGIGVYPINKRPFFNALVRLTEIFTKDRARLAVVEAIRNLLPKELTP